MRCVTADAEAADTPPPTGRLHGLPRAVTAPSSELLQQIFNACSHTSQDGTVAWAAPSPGLLHEPFPAWHTLDGLPRAVTAPSVVAYTQPHPDLVTSNDAAPVDFAQNHSASMSPEKQQ